MIYDDQILLTTGESAALLDVHESSIKRWCDGGSIDCAVTAGGHRRITLDELLGFAAAQGIPCPLLVFGPHANEVWLAWTRANRSEDYAGFSDLVYQWVSNGESILPCLLWKYIVGQGIPLSVLFDRVVSPVMHRVGADWQRGTLDVGDEHFISNVILDSLHELRQSCSSLSNRGAAARPVALIGCIEGERHEIGPHMARILLESKGWRTRFLGASIPAEDLVWQQIKSASSLVCISATPPSVPSDMIRQLNALSRLYNPLHPFSLALGGQVMQTMPAFSAADYPFEDCRVFLSMREFEEWLQAHSHQEVLLRGKT